MGKRGPKPKPTALKRAMGNPGKRKLPENEPVPLPESNLEPPEWIDEDAKEEWRRVVPELDRMGLYTQVDRSVLIGYCVAYSDYKKARKRIEEVGRVMTYRDDKGAVKAVQVSAEWTIAKQALEQMRKCGAEFGIGPASRVGLAGKDSPKVDALEAVLTSAPSVKAIDKLLQ